MKDLLRGVTAVLRVSWRQSRWRTGVSFVLVVLQAVAMPLAALALAALTDAAVAGDLPAVTVLGTVVACLVIASLTLGHFAHIAYYEVAELNALALDLELMALANGSARIEHQERPEYADRIAVLSDELHRIRGSIEALLNAVGLAVAMAITVVLLALLNPWLLLLPLVAVPPLVTGRKAEAIVDAARDEAAEPTRRARHLFSLAVDAGAAKELRLGRLQQEVRDRHTAAWAEGTAILRRAELKAACVRGLGQLIFAVGYVGGVLLVVREAVRGQGSVGDVVLAITLSVQVNAQVAQAVMLTQELQRTARGMARLRWLSELIASQEPPPATAPVPDRIERGVTLRGVTFGYPGTDRLVLRDVDLTLPAGSIVAIVGENGAGKTTLVKLLCRFYEAQAGTIEVDGVDVHAFDLHEWRQRISTGFQDFVRFELLARETIGVGELDRIDDAAAVTAALGRAKAEDVLDRLDDGLETQLGRRYADGAELSGGQWQKLALGRAMMRERPLILVLDEPTSALDAEAEHRLFEQYAENARRVGRETGALTVLVSHRFSTVRMADLILVVEGGKISEVGDHATLLQAGGLYAELYTLQAAAYR